MPLVILTTTDIAKRLGITQRRVAQIVDGDKRNRRREDFPKPYATTPSGMRFWRPQDIDRWARTADRRAGKRHNTNGGTR
jgi:hypothetical protein